MAQNPRDDATARAIDAAAVMKMVRDADAAGFSRRADTGAAPDRDFRKRDPIAFAQRVAAADGSPGANTATGPATAGADPATGATTPEGSAAPDRAPAPPTPAVLQARYEEGHAEGFEQGYAAGAEEGRLSGWTAGHDTGRREAEAELQGARDAFLNAVNALSRDDVIDLGTLVSSLTDAIRQLAAQRAGQAIDHMPGPFLDRIETLAHQARQGLEAVSIRLNPEDHAAITPHLPGAPLVAKSRITPDPQLGRGDVALRVGGIRLNDVLARDRTPERDA